MKRGIEICLKEFNDAGGYQGRKVEIPILDDQVKPEIAVNNITRFLNQDKVIAIIGPVNSGNALAFIPKTEEAEIPVIVPISTSVAGGLRRRRGVRQPATASKPKPHKSSAPRCRTTSRSRRSWATPRARAGTPLASCNDTTGYGTASKATADKLIPSLRLQDPGDRDLQRRRHGHDLAAAEDEGRPGSSRSSTSASGPENANLLRSAQKIDYKVQFSGAWGWSDPLVPQLAGQGPGRRRGHRGVVHASTRARPRPTSIRR